MPKSKICLPLTQHRNIRLGKIPLSISQRRIDRPLASHSRYPKQRIQPFQY